MNNTSAWLDELIRVYEVRWSNGHLNENELVQELINGEAEPIRRGLTLDQVLQQLGSKGSLDFAIAMSREILRSTEVRSLQIYHTLATSLWKKGSVAEAAYYYRTGLEAYPQKSKGSKSNLGWIYKETRDYKSAIVLFESALEEDDRYTPAIIGAAYCYLYLGNLPFAIRLLDRINLADYDVNMYILRVVLKSEVGEGADYLSDFLNSHSSPSFHNLSGISFVAAACLASARDLLNISKRAAFALRRELHLNHTYSSYLQNIRNFRFSRCYERMPKVGFVSADFSNSSLSEFIDPLFEELVNYPIEIFFFDNRAPIASTTRSESPAVCQTLSKSKHFYVREMDSFKLARLVNELEVDILIDLSGHSDGNRLDVFSLKPAPISITFGGSGESTGLNEIDYILTNPVIYPANQYLSSETPVFMDTVLSFRPRPTLRSIVSRPCIEGSVRLVCFSRGIRMNSTVFNAWAEILRQTTCATLTLNSRSFGGETIPPLFRKILDQKGVDPNRVQCLYKPLSECIHDMDLFLDTFPQNSGTTLMESAYCGLPFVTLSSRPGGTGRLGHYILDKLGLSENITFDVESYVARVVYLSGTIEVLLEQKRRIRESMKESSFMNYSDYGKQFYNMLLKL